MGATVVLAKPLRPGPKACLISPPLEPLSLSLRLSPIKDDRQYVGLLRECAETCAHPGFSSHSMETVTFINNSLSPICSRAMGMIRMAR